MFPIFSSYFPISFPPVIQQLMSSPSAGHPSPMVATPCLVTWEVATDGLSLDGEAQMSILQQGEGPEGEGGRTLDLLGNITGEYH